MAYININNLNIAGISVCIPKESSENSESVRQTTGIRRTHKFPEAGVCVSDLCYAAATDLLERLQWKKEEIGCLICVRQTPDYPVPPNSSILQHKLGLTMACAATDIVAGGSAGWVQGVYAIASALEHSDLKKGLLLSGDTLSTLASKYDNEVYPMVGDAGAATAFEWGEKGSAIHILLETAGKSFDIMQTPGSGCRNKAAVENLEYLDIREGVRRKRGHLVMETAGLSAFMTEKAKRMNRLATLKGIAGEDYSDHFLNAYDPAARETILKEMGWDKERILSTLEDYGDTSSASIPLALTSRRKELESGTLHHNALVFGPGMLSGYISFSTDRIACSPLLTL